MRRIEILHNIVPNLREIYIFGKKITFSSKTQAHLASWNPKKLIQRLKTVFFAETLSVKGSNLPFAYLKSGLLERVETAQTDCQF